MAPQRALWLLACFAAVLSVRVLGILDCEELAVEDCAFAVAGSGARCVLEKRITAERNIIYECQTSSVAAERSEAWIETDECLRSCGLQRMSVGLSTDGLVQREFVDKWCSPSCQNNCPNIIDLFSKLAAGEDIHLPHVCNYLRPASRRLIGESVISKGTQAAISSLQVAAAPEALLAEAPLSSILAEGLEPAASPSF